MELRSEVVDRFDAVLHDRLYVGRRTGPSGGDTEIVVVELGESDRPLQPRWSGSVAFEWSYSGSGPTETAWAILRDWLGCDEPPRLLVLEFREAFIAGARREGFVIAAVEIDAWLAMQGVTR